MYGPYIGHIGYMGLKAIVVTTLHLTNLGMGKREFFFESKYSKGDPC
jgi:hypothetical protein